VGDQGFEIEGSTVESGVFFSTIHCEDKAVFVD